MEVKAANNLNESDLVKTANFVLQKFLLRSAVIASEGKILEKELHDLQSKVKIKKINSIIQKI
jgi:hypothetical protein